MRSRTPSPWAPAVAYAVFVAVLLSPRLGTSAHAQADGPLSDDAGAAYDRAIAEAVSAYEREDFDATLRAFSSAHALFPNARTHRGLGITLYALGDYARSVEHLDAALASTEVPLDPELREQTQQLRDSAAQQVASAPRAVTPESSRVDAAAPQDADPPLEPDVVPTALVSAPTEPSGQSEGSDPLVRRARVAWALAGAAYGATALAILPWAMGRARLNDLSDWCANRPAGGCTVEQRDSEWEARHIDRLRRTARGLAIAGTVSAVVLTAVAWRGSRDRRVDVGVSLLEPGATLRLQF